MRVLLQLRTNGTDGPMSEIATDGPMSEIAKARFSV